jgi:hypothetical protein
LSDHSIDEAMEIQKAFERLVLPKTRGVLGVGIALNRSESDFALSVQVASEGDVKTLPEKFDGLDVIVDVVGANTAY